MVVSLSHQKGTLLWKHLFYYAPFDRRSKYYNTMGRNTVLISTCLPFGFNLNTLELHSTPTVFGGSLTFHTTISLFTISPCNGSAFTPSNIPTPQLQAQKNRITKYFSNYSPQLSLKKKKKKEWPVGIEGENTKQQRKPDHQRGGKTKPSESVKNFNLSPHILR